MTLLVKIADIPILIKSDGFLEALDSAEINLIKPFIKNTKLDQKKRILLVNIKELHGSNPVKTTPRINSEFRKKLELNFTQNKATFEPALRDFLANLYAYVVNKHIAEKTLLNIFKHNTHRIIINKGSFFIFNPKLLSVDIYYKKTESPFLLNFLMLAMRIVLNSKKEGIMLHASSIECERSGYVFIGPSGSGKSTILKMLKPERALCDDIAVIKKENGKYKIFANPWWNMKEDIDIINPHKPVRLKALFFITKANKTSFKRLSYKEALGRLIYQDKGFSQCGLFDNKIGDKNSYLFCHNLIQNIPVFEVQVDKNREFKKEFYCFISF